MQNIRVNPYGKALKDKNGDVKVEMALYAEKNSDGHDNAILKFNGVFAFSEGIDGKAFSCVAEKVEGGLSYVEKLPDGQKRLRLLMHYGLEAIKNIEVFVDGQKVKVFYSEEDTKLVKPLHLLAEVSKK